MIFKVTATKYNQFGLKVVSNTTVEAPNAYQVSELLRIQGFTNNKIQEIKC